MPEKPVSAEGDHAAELRCGSKRFFSRRSFKRIILGAVVLLLSILGTIIYQKIQSERARQYELRIAIINRFVSSTLQQYVIENGSLPEELNELSYWQNDIPLESREWLGEDFLLQNMGWLPETRLTEQGGIESARVWFAHYSNGDLFVSRDKYGFMGLPVLWYYYDAPDTGIVVAMTDGKGSLLTLPIGEFIPFLEGAFELAKANGIPYDPDQLKYAQSYL